MNQVVGCDATGQRGFEAVRVGGIALNDLDAGVIDPVAGGELARFAREAADAIAGIEQPADQASADVAGGAGDQNGAVSRGWRENGLKSGDQVLVDG
jgi:hypothetical protein